MQKQKVLIIKTGHTEILDKENNLRVMSLGDVLRTTPLLHLYKDSHVTWVTEKDAFPLLEGNPYIARLLPYDFTTMIQLLSEEFDTIINLEKIPGICALADKVRARFSRYGFTFNTQTGSSEAYDKAKNVFSVGSEREYKMKNQRPIQELLFELVGEEWKGEDYILGYKPKTKEVYDIGLNNHVGTKWPVKAWPMKKWDELENLLRKEGLSVTRQDKAGSDVLNNLHFYMDWINSCKMIITNDSLGLHIALALKKKVIGLFGPTPHKEFQFYGRGTVILPDPIQDCMPCFERECRKIKNCMEDISVERVYNTTKEIISQKIEKEKITKQELIEFEDKIKQMWENAEIPYYIHLSGGNEEQLIEIFKEITPGDYVFSTHRSHYHYLLKGGSPEELKTKILKGESMHPHNKKLNFISSAIVAGTPAIATGVAWALKKKKSENKVWCFVGDGAEDEGHFYEAVRYVEGWGLPCVFIIEDNNRSVETPKSERYGKSEINWPSCVRRYNYSPTTLHAGTDKFVNFNKCKIGSTM